MRNYVLLCYGRDACTVPAIRWLPGTCSGSARPVGLEVGSVCVCSALTATVANVLPSYCCI